MLYSAKMDGLLMRDHFYVRAGKVPKIEPFANRSAAFTSAATYAYAGGQVGLAAESMKESFEALEKSPTGNEMSKSLATKGLKIADIFTTFGPEVAVLSDWESGGLALPTLFAAAEIKDKAKARLFADLLVGGMGESSKIVKTEEDSATFWTMAGQVPMFQATIALNDTHLAFGLNSATLKSTLKQAKAGTANVPGRSDYQTAVKTVVAPKGGVLYVDLKSLFERLYEKLKPMAAFGIVGQPELAKYIDPAKLPKAETISRHLLPMVISWADAEGGTQMDSTGSVSLIQSYFPIVGGGMFWLFRSGQMVAPPATTSPAPSTPGK
jgi:hypothetical protein